MFELEEDNAMVGDFMDMVLAPVLAIRLFVLAWFVSIPFRHFDGMQRVSDDAWQLFAIGFSFVVVTSISWVFDFLKVIDRLGGSREAARTVDQVKKDS